MFKCSAIISIIYQYRLPYHLWFFLIINWDIKSLWRQDNTSNLTLIFSKFGNIAWNKHDPPRVRGEVFGLWPRALVPNLG